MTLRTAVPACSSSPIPAAAHRRDAPAALAPEQCRDLLDYLAQIPDPRHRHGRRHMLGAVLAVAVAAVVAGASSLVAIGEPATAGPLAAPGGRHRRQDPARQRPPRPRAGAPAGGHGPTTRAVLGQTDVDPTPTRSPGSGRCWTVWTLPTLWSPPTRSIPNASMTGWPPTSMPPTS